MARPEGTARGNVGFSNGERTWEERFDVVASLVRVLRARGHEVTVDSDTVHLTGTGVSLQPLLIGGVEPMDDGGVQTLTNIELHHAWLLPAGAFEFQHSAGADIAESLRRGFDQWVQVDLAPVLDALEKEPRLCSSIARTLESDASGAGRVRRAVLGPVWRVGGAGATEASSEHDAACPCCFLSQCWSAFEELLDGHDTVAIRLLGLRNQAGEALADCRVNGVDFEPGAAAIREYVARWPDRGQELRKQYVVVHTA